jgi:Short C-terminal domain/Bacterial PH domain
MTLKERFRTGQGMGTLSRGAILIYDDHVELTTAGLGAGRDSLRYEQIAQVMVDRGFRHATLTIQTTGGGGISVGGLNKAEAEAGGRLIEEQIAAVHSGGHAASQPAALTIPEQIRQLAALRDSGALTDDEFSSSKARLLDGPPS